MSYLSRFNIPFVGLALGTHKFEYAVDNEFFEHFKNAIIQKGSLRLELELKKQETMLVLDFIIKGVLDVRCDRCAGEFALPVSGTYNLIIQLGDEEKELSDNMISINRNAHEIHLAQIIYEYISLLLPQRIVHPDDEKGRSTCDPKTLRALKQFSNKVHEADPRWEALKKLNLK